MENAALAFDGRVLLQFGDSSPQGVQLGCQDFQLCWVARTRCELFYSTVPGRLWALARPFFRSGSVEILKLIPHARAGDETLRFDYAASHADPQPSEPVGTPLHFFKPPTDLEDMRMGL